MDILESIKTSLIDREIASKQEHRHQLLTNGERKIISTLREMLSGCDEFIISVAFITESGVSLILEQLRELEKRGIKGKILTGDYQTFTQPKALRRLMEFSNIEVKLLKGRNFHSKGYFFRKGEIWDIVIGSSNLTASALTTNFEWNLKISSSEKGELTDKIFSEFDREYKGVEPLDLKELMEYEEQYRENLVVENRSRRESFQEKSNQIKTNCMQREALENLERIRERESKALLISATGTGKTYLSCFDVERVKPKRLLFLAHRKTILERAKQTYKSLIKDKNIGIYGEENSSDYIFAMVQTLSKDEHLNRFERDYFDYIIVDEVHHGGAKTYQKILNYFKPKFLLGMTATPERTDNFNIFELFGYNIAYEIRLYEALKEELLVPFHYFGISDIEIDGELIDDKTAIKNLALDRRVEHILDKSRFYGWSGEKLHGLIFVSKVDEGKEIAKKMRERGVGAIFLSSEDSDEARERVIEQLERGEIEYILTVDIFNEGVDIPCINQILMIRPTNSSIIYIQQLGRGLRKYKDKEFVVIIDFIGNYEKNFLIPIALSQNNSYEKEELKQFLTLGTDIVPRESSISFEKIVAERILKNIGESNFSSRKNIEQDFRYLESRLGRTPFLLDFFENNLISPEVILRYKKNYDEILKIFTVKYRDNQLSELERDFLNFLSIHFTPAKRVHEMLILKDCIKNSTFSKGRVETILRESYSLSNQNFSIENGVKHLAKEIFTSYSVVKKYPPLLINNNGEYSLNGEFKRSYMENSYFEILIDDLINYNLCYAERNFISYGENDLILYKEYTKEESFWYLNLDYSNGYQVSGYTLFDDKRVGVIYITVNEKDRYDNTIKEGEIIKWFSKTSRYLVRDGKLTKEGKVAENFYTLHIFIKKQSGDKFYYIGEIEKVIATEEIINKDGKNLVEYDLKLKKRIEEILLVYLDN